MGDEYTIKELEKLLFSFEEAFMLGNAKRIKELSDEVYRMEFASYLGCCKKLKSLKKITESEHDPRIKPLLYECLSEYSTLTSQIAAWLNDWVETGEISEDL